MHTKLEVLLKLWKEMSLKEQESKAGKCFRAALKTAVILLEKNAKMEDELIGYRIQEYEDECDEC